MQNLLLERVEYQVEETPRGTWKRFLYPSGQYYSEFVSNTTVFGLPLLHYTRGKCPETGRRKVAKGFIAVGRMAVGVIAVGQASAGVLAFGQAAFGLLFGLGQLSVGAFFAAGQLAIGLSAAGQFGIGQYVLAQFGIGRHLWTLRESDPVAIQHFRGIWEWLSSHLPSLAGPGKR